MKPKKSKGIRMPRSDSRKYKRYRQMHPKEPKGDRPGQEHQSFRHCYFGDVQPRREEGVIDLTPYGAAIGQALISKVQYDNGRNTEQEHQNARLSYFGDVQPRREDGVIDLTPYGAAIGQALISTVQYDNGRNVVKRRGRPLKQRALDQ